MRHALVLSGFMATLLLAACGERPAEPADGTPQGSVQAARFDEDFNLRVGETANVGGQALTITFRRVSDDSRCPMDAVCVWMGDATVSLDVTVGRMAWTPFDVHTHVEPKKAAFRDFNIELVSLLPYPRSDSPIDPASYVVRLRVKRVG
jgi:hypothetical protein